MRVRCVDGATTLRDVLRITRLHGIEGAGIIDRGKAWELTLSLAHRGNIELLAMGTHGPPRI